MKTLEQILEHGNDAEKELVRLANDYPTDPVTFLVGRIISSSALLAGTSWLTYHLEDRGMIESIMMGVAGLTSLLSAISLIEASSVAYDYIQFKKEDKNVSSPSNVLFYTCDNKFTYKPTPIEIRLGNKIYPKNDFKEINKKYSEGYKFITDVVVQEMREEVVTIEESYFDDMSSANNKVKVEKIELQIKLEKNNTYFLIEDRYDVGKNNPIYIKLQKIKTPSISVLIDQSDNINKISDVFEYNSVVNSGEEKGIIK